MPTPSEPTTTAALEVDLCHANFGAGDAMPSLSTKGTCPVTADPTTTAAHCPRWENLGHNWLVIKGWLPWRRYRVCCACDHEERIK